MFYVDWDKLKDFVDNGFALKYIDLGNKYELVALDIGFTLRGSIPKTTPANSDQLDFENNYKANANKVALDAEGIPLQRLGAFCDSEKFRFRGKGMSGTGAAGTLTNIDYKVTEERFINGVRLILANHTIDDNVHFEIVDVDNVLGYGAGLVLDRFGDTWYVNPDMACQGDILIDYPAKIYAGLYIRVVYNSEGETDVKVKANLYLHKQTA